MISKAEKDKQKVATFNARFFTHWDPKAKFRSLKRDGANFVEGSSALKDLLSVLSPEGGS